MVRGIDKFREFFAGHDDQYAIIGGTACDLLFREAGLQFRATKDIDLVLCVKVIDAAFGEKFRAFLTAGGYQSRERSSGEKEYYRFQKPEDPEFPYMIELFSGNPGAVTFPEDAQIARIPVEDDVVSLSAILLDEDYFAAVQSAKVVIDGIAIADETVLIPFKARAFLDLTERKAKGEKVDQKNISKHRNDVFRLAQLLRTDARMSFADPVLNDLHRFLDIIEAEGELDPKSFDVPLSRDEAIALLRSVYSKAG